MPREISLSFSLGAKLAGSYRTAFQQAGEEAHAVARAIREMERTPVGTIGRAMDQQRTSIKSLSTELRGAQTQLESLRSQAGPGGATGLLARQIELAERRVNSLSGSLSRQLATWKTTTAQAANTAGSVQALSSRYAELSTRMERARQVQAALNAQQAQSAALRAQRDDLQSRLAGTLTGSTALGASVAIPVKLAISAEDTFADLAKVMDAPEAEMQQIFRDAQAMAARTGKSFEDIITIMTSAAQAGLGTTREQLVGVADQAVKMSIAWGVSAEQAGKSMATWQAAMGMSSQEAAHTADVINALSNAMNATAGEIDQIFTRMGPLMKGTGFTSEQVAALATAFKAAGAEVEVSGTAMKNFVKVMAAGEAGLTDQRKAIYKYLQIDPNELQKELQTNAMGAVMRVLEALQKVRPEERNSISSLLFGDESIAAITPLMTQVDTLKKAMSIATGDVAGSVQQEYENRMKTAATAVSQLTQSVRNLGISAGNALLPAVTAIARGLTRFIGGVQVLVDRFPRLSGAIMTAMGVTAGLAAGSLALSLVMNVVRTGIGGVAGGLLRMAASQVTATTATNGLTMAQRIQAGVSTLVSGGFRAIGGAIRFAMGPLGLIMSALTVAAGLIIDNWSTVGPFFQNLWNGIVGAFQAAWNVIQGIIQKIAGAISWIGDAIDKIPVLGSAKRGIGKAIDAVFGDDKKESATATAAKAAADKSTAAASTSTTVAATAPAADKAASESAARAAAMAAEESRLAANEKYFDKSFDEFMKGKGGAKAGGGGGGSSSSSSGPLTVVSYAGDNNRLQTVFIPAGGRAAASPLGAAVSSAQRASTPTVTPSTVLSQMPAMRVPAVSQASVLPSAPASVSRVRRQREQAPDSPRELTINVSQEFDILSSDPRAAQKLLESIRPDMEALIRRALARLDSNQRRTVYAQ